MNKWKKHVWEAEGQQIILKRDKERYSGSRKKNRRLCCEEQKKKYKKGKKKKMKKKVGWIKYQRSQFHRILSSDRIFI